EELRAESLLERRDGGGLGAHHLSRQGEEIGGALRRGTARGGPVRAACGCGSRLRRRFHCSFGRLPGNLWTPVASYRSSTCCPTPLCLNSASTTSRIAP